MRSCQGEQNFASRSPRRALPSAAFTTYSPSSHHLLTLLILGLDERQGVHRAPVLCVLGSTFVCPVDTPSYLCQGHV